MLVLIVAIHSKSKTPAPGAEAPFANSQNMGQEERAAPPAYPMLLNPGLKPTQAKLELSRLSGN